ncbi:MAG: hypothetical protein ACXVZ1_00470 [Gaiellaceae bacterium]
MLWLWLPLAFLLAVLVAGSVFCVLRALEAYRRLRSLARGVASEMSSFGPRLERTGRELEAGGAGFERLSAALERLAHSRGRLRILRSSLADLDPIAAGIRLLRAR